jgi:hypothetical protein
MSAGLNARIALLAATSCVVGCNSPQFLLATGNPALALSAMKSDGVKGGGSVTQYPDGSRSFRYTIPADACDGLIAPEQIEHQRTEMLARWVASENACPGTYAIRGRYEQAGALYYEGTCT